MLTKITDDFWIDLSLLTRVSRTEKNHLDIVFDGEPIEIIGEEEVNLFLKALNKHYYGS